MCYHVIGDTLRGGGLPLRRAIRAQLRGAARVRAHGDCAGRARSRPLPVAWAVAATIAAVTVVGWVAIATLDRSPTAIAKAREAATVRAAQLRPPAVPTDYLLAHREYSPTAPMEGIGPGLRPAAAGIGRCRGRSPAPSSNP